MSDDILGRIDAAVDGLCPCGAEPALGSAWCSEDCRPVPGAGAAYLGEAEDPSHCFLCAVRADPSRCVWDSAGIRPHRPRTLEQDRVERELAEQYVRNNPVNSDMIDFELPNIAPGGDPPTSADFQEAIRREFSARYHVQLVMDDVRYFGLGGV